MPKLALILLERSPLLTFSQLDKLADIFINVGTLFFGSGVVPYVIPDLDRPPFIVLIFGLVASLVSWGFALWTAKKGDYAI